MKCLSEFLFLFIVLLRTEFVKPTRDLEPYSRRGVTDSISDADASRVNNCQCPLPKHGVYTMGFTIGVLFLIIIALLIVIYKLRYTVYSESISDHIEITKTDCSNKYTRQLSSEPSNVTYTRENSNDDGRLKLQRQGSKMTIVDYPLSFNTNEKKLEEPNNSTIALAKVMHQQPVQIQRDRMKEICQGVLSKTQRLNASTNSLSNLEKILSEDAKAKELESYAIVDKSASSGLLDIVENFKSLPSPISVNRTNVFPDFSQNNLSLHNININNKSADEAVEDDIYDNPPQSNRPVITGGCNTEHIDDVYDNPPNVNRPFLNEHSNEDHIDEVYDNPPNVKRPVMNSNDSYLEDVYDNVPNNRPIPNNTAEAHLNDVYDNPNSNKLVFTTSKRAQREGETSNDDDYVCPQKTGRGIVVTDDHSGYLSPMTNDKETCFDPFYINAKSLNRNKC